MERTRTRGNAPPRQPARGRRRRLKKRSLVLLTLAVGFVAWSAGMSGCGRTEEDVAAPRPAGSRPPAVATAPPPLPLPAATQPATEPAANGPSYLFFQYANGDGQEALGAVAASADGRADSVPANATPWGLPKAFPPARLMLTDKKDGPVLARLFSDDPEEALSPKWTGDRYYIEMPLHADSVAQLDGEVWAVTASNGDLPETTNGVYLKGDRYHLVPVDVQVAFEGQAPRVRVRLAGRFLQTDSNDPTAPPKSVFVQGVLMPRVEIK